MTTERCAPSIEVLARGVVITQGHVLVARLRGQTWSHLPGGHVEAGEVLVEALGRELNEELGVQTVAADPIGTVEYPYVDDDGRPRHEINHVFHVTVDGLPDRPNPPYAREDWLEFTWIPLAELGQEPLRPEPLKRALLHWAETGTMFQVAHAVQDLGGYADPFRLRQGDPSRTPATIRRSARALLVDNDDRLVLFKRTVPGRELYWTTPGGRVEPSDYGDLEATLRRELDEELGATAGHVQQVFTVRQQGGGMARVQHFFACRLTHMDLSQRTGEEFDDPARGTYEIVRIPFTPDAISKINLYPEDLRDFLAADPTTIQQIRRIIDRARLNPDLQ